MAVIDQEFQLEPSLKLWVAFESAREEALRGIGAHSSQSETSSFQG